MKKITLTKHSEELKQPTRDRAVELEQEKSKLRQITQHMATGALLLDAHGEVAFVNKEARKILGLKGEDNNKALQKLYSTFESASIEKHVKKCLAGKPTKISEIPVDEKIFEV